MASPPFNINQALPGDGDIVSQHPPNARTFRDIVESWLLINHDTNGNHARIDMPRITSPTTPAANIDVLFVSTTGRLKIKHPDGTEEFVGMQPGAYMYHAQAGASVPGWLYANGAAVSRSTYADLFNTIGTTFGNGDNVTTFNVPDLRGRVTVGNDDGAGRISTATMNSSGLAGVGGSETSTLLASNVPGGVSVSVNSLSVAVTVSSVTGTISGTVGAQTASGSVTGTASGGTVTGTPTGSISGTASVTSGDNLVHVGGVSDNYSSVAGAGTFNAPTRKALTSTGPITGSFAGAGLSGASLSSPATVSGSFSGASVSTGAVSGTFSGNGSGAGTGTGVGATVGSAIAFSNMQPSIVGFPYIKT